MLSQSSRHLAYLAAAGSGVLLAGAYLFRPSAMRHARCVFGKDTPMRWP
jgi:hypothetical protein